MISKPVLRCVAWAIFAAVLWTLPATGAVGADPNSDPELKKIADAARKWRKSIVNLRIKCEWTWEKGHLSSKELSAKQREGRDILQGCDWIWTDSGKYRRYDWSLNRSQNDGDSLSAVDGERKYVFRTGSNRFFRALHGLWFPSKYKSRWLSDLLDAGKGELTGTENIDGRELPKLKVIKPSGFPVSITVDPRYGYLPRVVDGGSKARLRTEIEEYQYLKTPGIWFPKKGVMTAWDPEKGEIYSRSHWRITEVKVNTDLPMSLFRPPILSDAPPFDAQRVSGAPQPSFWKRWAVPLLITASLLLLIVATWVRRRTQRGGLT